MKDTQKKMEKIFEAQEKRNKIKEYIKNIKFGLEDLENYVDDDEIFYSDNEFNQIEFGFKSFLDDLDKLTSLGKILKRDKHGR